MRAGKGGQARVVPHIDNGFLSERQHLSSPRVAGLVFCANGRQAMSLRLVVAPQQ